MAMVLQTLLALLTLVAVATAGTPGSLRGSARLRQMSASDFDCWSRQKPSQVVVFDAGSSGTRVCVIDMTSGQHVPQIDLSAFAEHQKNARPGLSEFANKDDMEGAKQQIEHLLGFAKGWALPTRSTPVLLKATAGLRAVNQTKAENVLHAVREVLSASGYLFQDEWAHIAEGKEEGGLAWVAANYLQGVFADPFVGETHGVFEMGGGSIQVAFEVDEEIPADVNSFSFSTISGKEFKLYAHSYQGFGQNYAQTELQHLLTAGTADVMEDPCYPVGYSRLSTENASIRIEGAGNAQKCTSLIRSQLMTSVGAPGRYSHELHSNASSVAFKGFMYARREEHLKLSWPLDPASLQHDAERGCSASCEELKCEEIPSFVTDATLWPNHCFGLSYHVAFFEALKNPQGKVIEDINGTVPEWVLGAALQHAIDTGLTAASNTTTTTITTTVTASMSTSTTITSATGSTSTSTTSSVSSAALKSQSTIIMLAAIMFLGVSF